MKQEQPRRTDELRLAAETPCDPHTARRALRGELAGMRPMTRERVLAAMARLGLRPLHAA